MSSIRRAIYGRSWLQPLFEKMLTVSLGGMNYCNVDIEHNGELGVLKRLLGRNESTVIFDVGANAGQYYGCVRKILGPSVVIHAFEPSKEAYRLLGGKCDGDSSVFINNHALGSSPGKATLHCNTPGGSGSSIHRKDFPNAVHDYPLTESIEVLTLDDYVANHPVPEISLLKIDVEGFELEVLRGATRSLREGLIKRIQFEFGEGSVNSGTHFKSFFELLSDQFRLYRVVADGLRPIDRYSLVLEQFVTANYYAELR